MTLLIRWVGRGGSYRGWTSSLQAPSGGGCLSLSSLLKPFLPLTTGRAQCGAIHCEPDPYNLHENPLSIIDWFDVDRVCRQWLTTCFSAERNPEMSQDSTGCLLVLHAIRRDVGRIVRVLDPGGAPVLGDRVRGHHLNSFSFFLSKDTLPLTAGSTTETAVIHYRNPKPVPGVSFTKSDPHGSFHGY